MVNSHNIQLTGDNYYQIFDYLKENSEKVLKITPHKVQFLLKDKGYVVIGRTNILSFFDVNDRIVKGIDKIIYANMPLSGEATEGF